MAKTRRSADVLSAMDPAQLRVNNVLLRSAAADNVNTPRAVPVSPSHSSSDDETSHSSSRGGENGGFQQQHQHHQEESCFFATLVSDPLYIHGQIMLEMAAKEEQEAIITAAKNNNMNETKKHPVNEKVSRVTPPGTAPMTVITTRTTGQEAPPMPEEEKKDELLVTTRKSSAPRSASTTTAAKPNPKKQRTAKPAATGAAATGTTAATSSSSSDSSPASVKLLSVLYTCARSPHPMLVRTTPIATIKPNTVLHSILKKNSLPSLRIRAKQSNYAMKAPISAIRLASFGSKLCTAVDASDIRTLSHWFEQYNVSPNPCNKFADDVLFTICKRSNSHAVFRCFVTHGADVRIVDSLGRTPLHYCAWAEQFDGNIVKTLLQMDPQQLFMEDFRGQTPLDHVNDSVAKDWNAFLLQHFTSLYGPASGGLPLVQSLEQRSELSNEMTTNWTQQELDDIKDLVGAGRSSSRPCPAALL